MESRRFRVRSKARDRARDIERFGRICDMLKDLLVDIAREAEGLQRRYRDAADSAAFACQAFEDGERDLSAKADEMAVAMARYARRTGELDVQDALLSDVLRKLQPFAGTLDNASEPASPAFVRRKGVDRVARILRLTQKA